MDNLQKLSQLVFEKGVQFIFLDGNIRNEVYLTSNKLSRLRRV